MNISGEISFSIAHDSSITDELNSTIDINPSIKRIKKGQPITLNLKAPKNILSYSVKFPDELSFNYELNRFGTLLIKEVATLEKMVTIYEDVSINFYIRSEYGQMGWSIPKDVLKNLATLGIDINFHILSFGHVE